MSAAWLTAPIMLDGSREFSCDGMFDDEQCTFYMKRWHFWYIADYVFARPTVAFFMCAIGIFIIGHFISSQLLGYRKFRGPPIWQKTIAVVRYLSYRGFHVKALKWNSAPVGVLLLGLAGTVFFFCMDLIPQSYYWADIMFGGSPPLATRSGWMALACMPFVFATATKTNWITLLTGVSHERLQVFHRWISYAFFILALLHTFPFIVYHIHWHDMEEHFASSLIFYWTGIVALIFQAWLTFASHSVIRNWNYEFFKATHFFAVVIFMITFFWHCDYTLTSWDYFIATAAIYVPCYLYPWLRTFFEHGITQKATLFVEENGFTRITIPAKFDWKPGQHCFLRFTSFGFSQALSTHPFTICSLPSTEAGRQSELVFYIRHQKGFTAKLYQKAFENPGGVEVSVWVDGPYGGINSQRFFEGENILVVAGGSGAGWILPFVEQFVRYTSLIHPDSTSELGSTIEDEKSMEGRSGLRRRHEGLLSLRVVLATRDIASRTWFLRTINDLLSTYESASTKNINIQVFLTGEASSALPLDIPNPSKHEEEITTASKTSSSSSDNHIQIPAIEKEFQGRPDLPSIVKEEAEKGEGGLSVFVCGPDSMQHEVRNAVAEENLRIVEGKKGSVYLHSEHFSWA